MAESQASFEARMAESRARFDAQMAQLWGMVQNMQQQQGPKSVNDGPRINSNNNGEGNPRNFDFTPKIEFPVFDGSEPMNWVKNCREYFDLYNIADNERVRMASLHMIDDARSFGQDYLRLRPHADWFPFILEVGNRFGGYFSRNKDQSATKDWEAKFGKLKTKLDEFRVLQQQNHMKDQNKFQESMNQHNSIIVMDMCLEITVDSGGVEGIRPFNQVCGPMSMYDAFENGKSQEISMNVRAVVVPEMSTSENCARNVPKQLTDAETFYQKSGGYIAKQYESDEIGGMLQQESFDDKISPPLSEISQEITANMTDGLQGNLGDEIAEEIGESRLKLAVEALSNPMFDLGKSGRISLDEKVLKIAMVGNQNSVAFSQEIPPVSSEFSQRIPIGEDSTGSPNSIHEVVSRSLQIRIAEYLRIKSSFDVDFCSRMLRSVETRWIFDPGGKTEVAGTGMQTEAGQGLESKVWAGI